MQSQALRDLENGHRLIAVFQFIEDFRDPCRQPFISPLSDLEIMRLDDLLHTLSLVGIDVPTTSLIPHRPAHITQRDLPILFEQGLKDRLQTFVVYGKVLLLLALTARCPSLKRLLLYSQANPVSFYRCGRPAQAFGNLACVFTL